MLKGVTVGVSGPPRAGKNTIVDYLVEVYGFHHLAVSTPIKEMSHDYAQSLFTEADKDQPQEILNGKTPRDLYIHVGNLDEFVPWLWAEPTARKIGDPEANWVIESVGKQGQWDTFLAMRPTPQLYVLAVDRPGCAWDNRSAIDDYVLAYDVLNDGTIERLHQQVDQFLALIRERPVHRHPDDVRKFLEKGRSPLLHRLTEFENAQG